MKKYILVATLLFSVPSFASLLLEPYVGYGFATLDSSSGTTYNGKIKPATYVGGRIGFSLPLVFFALDISGGSPKIKFDSGTTEYSGKRSMVGADLGIHTPLIGLRAWAGYIFRDRLTQNLTSGGDHKFVGKGYKLGLGYQFPILPLAINGEYIVSQYDKRDDVDLSNKVDNQGFLISVSFPFEL